MLAVKEDCCRTLASIKCHFTDTIELVSVRFCALSLPARCQPSVRGATVAATSAQPKQNSTLEPEVAAVKSPRPPKKNNKGGNNKGQTAAPTPTSTTTTAGNKGPRHATAKGDNDKLCRIHYRWGENGTYCAAPWKCPMKNVFKAPQ